MTATTGSAARAETARALGGTVWLRQHSRGREGAWGGGSRRGTCKLHRALHARELRSFILQPSRYIIYERACRRRGSPAAILGPVRLRGGASGSTSGSSAGGNAACHTADNMADSAQAETKAAAHKPAVTAFDQVRAGGVRHAASEATPAAQTASLTQASAGVFGKTSASFFSCWAQRAATAACGSEGPALRARTGRGRTQAPVHVTTAGVACRAACKGCVSAGRVAHERPR